MEEKINACCNLLVVKERGDFEILGIDRRIILNGF
jgi:hypothetical protein